MSYAVYLSLVNKNVMTTGGDSDIGAAIVEGFAKQGARITLLGVVCAGSEALAASFGRCVYPPVFRHCDLRGIDALNVTSPDTEADASPIGVLVNNAANDNRHQIGATAQAYWDNRIEVDLRHQFFCVQTVLLSMKKLGCGAILNLGSIPWHLAQVDLAIYMTAKTGIKDLTHDLTRDLGGFGVRVSYIVPSAVRTSRQMTLQQSPESETKLLDEQCPHEHVEPEHMARMALFLASDDTARCMAREYFVDAGWYGG